jgi:hypothetical protein
MDGWWKGSWFWSKAWGKPSFGWRRWLIHLGGIVRDVFGLRPRWTPNVVISSRGLLEPRHEGTRQRWGVKARTREDSNNECRQ